MPFIQQVIQFIDSSLKAGSLNKEKLQPSNYIGLVTTSARKKDATKPLELLPAVVEPKSGKVQYIAPDSKYALQVYHRLISKQYSFVKKSYGEGNDIKSTSDLAMVVFTNSKITGVTKEILEPLFLFGMPQKLSDALLADLKINSCLITPVSSNLDQVAVWRQEFPQSDYSLTEQVSMFLIRYKVEMTFTQKCIEACLCN